VATGGPPRGGEASVRWGSGGEAAVVGLALRFALNARPAGSQGFAPGKANDKEKPKTRAQKEQKNKNQRKNKKGTLLMR
jgi:hypothetical protein